MRISARGNDVDIYATVEEINEMLSSNYNSFEEEYYSNCNKDLEADYLAAVNKLIDSFYDEMCEA